MGKGLSLTSFGAYEANMTKCKKKGVEGVCKGGVVTLNHEI